MHAVLHLEEINGRKELHDLLSRELQLPEWYGRNLDALWDCLTDLCEETEVEIWGVETFEEEMGDYVRRLVQLMKDAAEENACLHVTIR